MPDMQRVPSQPDGPKSTSQGLVRVLELRVREVSEALLIPRATKDQDWQPAVRGPRMV